VGGSIHPGEDETLVAVFRALREKHPALRLVLVPRHPERFDRAEEVVRKAGLACRRRTAEGDPSGEAVILIDTMGELGTVYGFADLVFVGGSLVPHGGQNMMEPAAFGKAVLFGPYVHNFTDDAAYLLERGAAVQVKDEKGLEEALETLLSDPDRAGALGAEAAKAVAGRRGATQRTLDALEKVYLGAI
jgi:3-deoxy-D-manno-octulosonic-acid transferase